MLVRDQSAGINYVGDWNSLLPEGFPCDNGLPDSSTWTHRNTVLPVAFDFTAMDCGA